jgi:hypothetical protein
LRQSQGSSYRRSDPVKDACRLDDSGICHWSISPS